MSIYMDITERMLKDTRLVDKLLMIKKKVANKMDAIIKDYKNIRIKAEGSGWDTNVGTYKIYNLNSSHSTIVGDFILKKYL